MTVKITGSFDPEDDIEAAIRATQTELGRLINDHVVEIKVRTTAGRDANEIPFHAYTPQYYKFKTSRGRTGRVDLTFTGAMLSSLTSQVKRLGNQITGLIFFASAHEALKARGNEDNGRQFFALSDGQIEEVKKRFDAAVTKLR